MQNLHPFHITKQRRKMQNMLNYTGEFMQTKSIDNAMNPVQFQKGERVILTFTPESFSSFATESMTTISFSSSLIHIGRGVPQNLLRLIAQSLAFSSQL